MCETRVGHRVCVCITWMGLKMLCVVVGVCVGRQSHSLLKKVVVLLNVGICFRCVYKM